MLKDSTFPLGHTENITYDMVEDAKADKEREIEL